jgi:predicted MFS family arabinose efflux permease
VSKCVGFLPECYLKAFLRALRYCGNTFAYTAVAILLNYSKLLASHFIHALTSALVVTPPHAVGLANGVGQSIVSLARCFGPVLGGYVSRGFSYLRLTSCSDVFCFDLAVGS